MITFLETHGNIVKSQLWFLRVNIIGDNFGTYIMATYRKTSTISRTLVGNKIVDNSDEVGATPITKANLRDLIAATGLVILVQLDSNRRFVDRVTLKFDGWPRKIVRHISYTTSSFVYHFISISKFKLELQSGNAQSFIPWLCVFNHMSSGWLTMLPYVIRMRQLIFRMI